MPTTSDEYVDSEVSNAAVHHSAAAMAAREGDGETPRMEDWEEHAVDPRDHRDER